MHPEGHKIHRLWILFIYPLGQIVEQFPLVNILYPWLHIIQPITQHYKQLVGQVWHMNDELMK
jgi:hypothetical protein